METSSSCDATSAPDHRGQMVARKRALLACLQRRECWCLTWRGRIVLLLFLFGLGIAGLLGIHPFLAPNRPVTSSLLVVEGWVADYGFKAAAAEFSRGGYQKLFVTGGPLEVGAPLVDYKTYAELGAATLLKYGINSNSVQAVPAPRVQQDRTFN